MLNWLGDGLLRNFTNMIGGIGIINPCSEGFRSPFVRISVGLTYPIHPYSSNVNWSLHWHGLIQIMICWIILDILQCHRDGIRKRLDTEWPMTSIIGATGCVWVLWLWSSCKPQAFQYEVSVSSLMYPLVIKHGRKSHVNGASMGKSSIDGGFSLDL